MQKASLRLGGLGPAYLSSSCWMRKKCWLPDAIDMTDPFESYFQLNKLKLFRRVSMIGP